MSKNLQQGTDDLGVGTLGKGFPVVHIAVEDVADSVTVEDVVDIDVVETGWVGDVRNIISIDGLNINEVSNRGHDPADDLLNLVIWEGPEDGVKFWGDVLVDEELLQENFLQGDGLNVTGGGHDFLVNLDVDDPWLFNDDLLFSSDWLNNDFLPGRRKFNFSSDLGGLSNDWFVQEQSFVDFVQKELVVGVGVDVEVVSVLELTSNVFRVVPVEGVPGVG